MDATHTAATRRKGSPTSAAAGRVIALFNSLEGCSRALRDAVAQLAAKHELAATQLLALWACGETDTGVGQSDLATRIGVSPAQASALVEQLRKYNLIESHRDATDRRRQFWKIAEAGRNVLLVVADELANLADKIGMTFADDPFAPFEAGLNHLAAAVTDSAPSQTNASGIPRLRVVSPPEGDADRNEPDAIRSSREVAK